MFDELRARELGCDDDGGVDAVSAQTYWLTREVPKPCKIQATASSELQNFHLILELHRLGDCPKKFASATCHDDASRLVKDRKSLELPMPGMVANQQGNRPSSEQKQKQKQAAPLQDPCQPHLRPLFQPWKSTEQSITHTDP